MDRGNFPRMKASLSTNLNSTVPKSLQRLFEGKGKYTRMGEFLLGMEWSHICLNGLDGTTGRTRRRGVSVVTVAETYRKFTRWSLSCWGSRWWWRGWAHRIYFTLLLYILIFSRYAVLKNAAQIDASTLKSCCPLNSSTWSPRVWSFPS